MLNSNMEMFLIPMPTSRNYRILTRRPASKHVVLISYLTKEEEETIDTLEKGYLKLDRGNRTFTIKGNQICCYGELDLTNPDDIAKIKNLDFLNYLGGVGKVIPARYDYETHTARSKTKKYQITETFSPLDLIKFNHACLGKPERIIVFTQH